MIAPGKFAAGGVNGRPEFLHKLDRGFDFEGVIGRNAPVPVTLKQRESGEVVRLALEQISRHQPDCDWAASPRVDSTHVAKDKCGRFRDKKQ